MKKLFGFIACVVSFCLWAQKPSVSLIVDTKSAAVGDLVSFTVKSNVEGSVSIDFPPNFIQGYGTSSGMEQVMDYGSGSVTTIYHFTQNGAFKENGTYVIYAYVKGKKSTYKSNKVTVKVEKNGGATEDEISKKTFKQPVFGLIKKSKNQIYEGEPLVLEAKIYSRLNINMLEGYQTFEVDGGSETHELDKSQKLLLNKEQYKGSTFLTFCYGKQLVFPNSTGKIKVKPFEMSLQYSDGGIFSERIAFTSTSSTVEVLPLPAGAPANFIGAVGSFELLTSLNKNKVKVGDVIKLSVTVKGIGNLHNIQKPTLKLPKGIVVYGDPEVKDDYTFGENGAEGSITYLYHLQIKQGGVDKLPGIAIAYFDPNQKKYVQAKANSIALQNDGGSVVASISSTPENQDKKGDEAHPFASANVSDDLALSPTLGWSLVLSPLALAFVGLFFFSKKPVLRERKAKTTPKPSIAHLKQQLLAINIEDCPVKAAYVSIENNIKEFAGQFCARDLSKTEVVSELQNTALESEVIGNIKAVLTRCEEARFAFDENREHLKETHALLLSSYQKLS